MRWAVSIGLLRGYNGQLYPQGTATRAEIAAMVVRHEVDLAVFLVDDLNPQPHEADIQMLLRQCRLHNVPIACNRISADLMISSPLWPDENYTPAKQNYVHFER